MKMPGSNNEVAKLLKQFKGLGIGRGGDIDLEGTCKHLALKVIQDQKNINNLNDALDETLDETDDEGCDSDEDDVLHAGRNADPDSEDDDDGTECSTKCPPPPTKAVPIILDGSNQEEIIEALRDQSNKLHDPAKKLDFFTKREALDQGYSVTPIEYSAFTNKIRILKFLLDELHKICANTLLEHLDQRDRDGNNMLMAMAASQLDLSDAFKVLFNFQHYPHDGKKYFMVNHRGKNHKEETIFKILERNNDIASRIKESIKKTLKELNERPEFEQEWVGDVLASTNQQPIEEDRLVEIVQNVSDPHANITIREDNQPKAAPNPEQELENALGEGVEDVPVPVPEQVPQAIPGPGHDNVPANIPAPGVNLPWVCAAVHCEEVYQTKEEAQQCAQSHGEGDVMPFDENGLGDGVAMEGFLLNLVE